MSALTVLTKLVERGFWVGSAGRDIVVTGDLTKLDDDIRAQVRGYRNELIRLLDERTEWFQERAAIIEYDGQVDRVTAEQIAWRLGKRRFFEDTKD